MKKAFPRSLSSAIAAGALVFALGLPQTHAQSSVSFTTEGDTTETQRLGGHTCGDQSLLERVTLNFRVGAVDSLIPGTGINGLGVENLDPVSGGEVESCNELVQVSLSVPGGPSNARLSVSNPQVCLTANLERFDGTTDFGGASGQSLPNATSVDVSDTVTITGSDLAFFTSAGFDVQFVFDARGVGSNETADAAFANGLDGSGSASVAYQCGVQFCELPGAPDDLPANDPRCRVCEFDSSLLADDPNCQPPPPPIPGMTISGLLVSLLGLPLIAGFFASRRRRSGK